MVAGFAVTDRSALDHMEKALVGDRIIVELGADLCDVEIVAESGKRVAFLKNVSCEDAKRLARAGAAEAHCMVWICHYSDRDNIQPY
jgi:hypothetical protein